jgi:hypothetical protein
LCGFQKKRYALHVHHELSKDRMPGTRGSSVGHVTTRDTSGIRQYVIRQITLERAQEVHQAADSIQPDFQLDWGQ